MQIPATAAMWFLPFVLPICFYVIFTDMREMRIKNHAVKALTLVFVIVGLFALPPWSGPWLEGESGPLSFSLPIYLWQLFHLAVVMFFAILLTAAGAMGAGDAKFCASAAPFIWLGDLMVLMAIVTASILGAVTTHRLVKYSALRRIAPDWKSWDTGNRFPMGFVLAGSLSIYLILGIFYGS
ncbi:prepilin peptidase [Roseibium sp. RKSG952]|uniref:prepilin peptidase n=1 Tax=Roseibium sp. RKSG952 TaxID=2529384 RepID=UPI0012BD17A9|nr:hypothetical protein [Roseibium sp. RKSG952]